MTYIFTPDLVAIDTLSSLSLSTSIAATRNDSEHALSLGRIMDTFLARVLHGHPDHMGEVVESI